MKPLGSLGQRSLPARHERYSKIFKTYENLSCLITSVLWWYLCVFIRDSVFTFEILQCPKLPPVVNFSTFGRESRHSADQSVSKNQDACCFRASESIRQLHGSYCFLTQMTLGLRRFLFASLWSKSKMFSCAAGLIVDRLNWRTWICVLKLHTRCTSSHINSYLFANSACR